MKVFVTGVTGQLGHDVVNELERRNHEGIGSDIQEIYSGLSDGTAVTTVPYVQLDITNRNVVKDIIEPSSMTIEYASAKNTINFAKHGISFATASLAFNNQNALITYDELHSDTEDRFTLLGAVNDHILFIVYTMRGEVIRLISARPATKRERERYYRQGGIPARVK